MTITWLGQNCFKIEGKDAVVLVDPANTGSGKMPRVQADIVLLPQALAEKDREVLKPDSFVVETPGEFDSKGVFVTGQVFGSKIEVIYRFEVEGVSFGHLNSTARANEEATAFLEGVDVLFVPVGGGHVMGPIEAASVVSEIEPRLVIPMHFREASVSKLEPVEKFCQAMGVKNPERVKKLSLQKKDLPHEETRLVILES